MYWTRQNLKDSENKQEILHYGSIFGAAMVADHLFGRNSWRKAFGLASCEGPGDVVV
jgi:hypothetical protein